MLPVLQLCGLAWNQCATCDGFFFKGKDVVVVGGGEVAVEETLSLTKLVKSVMVIHRRDRLKAAKILEQKAFNNKKISFIWNSVVEEILGDRKVEGVRLKNVQNSDQKSDIKFRNQIELDDKGYIKKYEGSKTSVDGIFVAGDVYDYVL